VISHLRVSWNVAFTGVSSSLAIAEFSEVQQLYELSSIECMAVTTVEVTVILSMAVIVRL
jgi:hypothetical protein